MKHFLPPPYTTLPRCVPVPDLVNPPYPSGSNLGPRMVTQSSLRHGASLVCGQLYSTVTQLTYSPLKTTKKQKTCHQDRSCGSTAWLQYSCVEPGSVSAMSWWKSWRWKGEHEFDCWGVCDVAGGKWGLGGSFTSLYIAQGQNLLRNIIFVFRGFYAFYTKDSRIEVCLKLMRQQ